jgi:hypothetical protein
VDEAAAGMNLARMRMKTANELETKRLEAANRHIVAIEERIEMQRSRVARLKGNGIRHDESEKLLMLLLDTLGVMRRYRQQVVDHLVAIRTGQRDRDRSGRDSEAGE